jgi:hypothetical protein
MDIKVMNPQQPISPEIFEDIINNFIINEKNLLVNHVVVHDVKVEYKNKYEHYILNVTVYVKEGSIVEGRFKDLGTNIKWNSFVNGLNQHKVFKKYLGLPLNNDYEDFYVSIEGDIDEGYPKNEKIMETKDLIKKVLKEEISSLLRRRLNFGKIDSILKNIKVQAFRKDEPIENSINATIQRALYDLMPEGFDDDDEEYFKVWDEIKDYLKDNYTDELREYFEKRKKDAEDDKKNSRGEKYIFAKHDKPYGSLGWSGFADGFNSFDEMITKYGHWVDVDWDEVKKKLDNITEYPEETFSGTMNSRPLRISSIGDEGNRMGYNFSIIKSIPKNRIKEIKEGELTERCWKGYTQKGMKTMFGKRYPNCVKKKKG